MKKMLLIFAALLLVGGSAITSCSDSMEDIKVQEVTSPESPGTNGDSGSGGGTNLPPKP